jgi:hypothetical protein
VPAPVGQPADEHHEPVTHPPAAPPIATSSADSTPIPAPPGKVSRPEVPVVANLIPAARFALVQHEQTTGRTITVDELAARMSLTPAVAGRLLTSVFR